jgi:hypothetical protein
MTSASLQAECWPDPETLEQRDVDRLFVELRDRREMLMRQLRDLQLQAGADPSPAAFIDVMEARANLNALLAYWRQLLARELSLQDWAPLGSEPPCFAEVRGDGRYRAARALTPLTPDSLLFVHGPVSLWHCAALAEELLEAGDRLTRLVKAAFHRELTFEPQIIVWDKALGAAPLGFDPDAVAVSGLLESASGRQFSFVALPDTGHIPTRRAAWHPLTASIIASQPAKTPQPTAFNYSFAPDCFPNADGVTQGSSVLFAKTEALVAAFTQHILVGERVLLFSRWFVQIDAQLAAWLACSPQVHIEIDWTRQKPIPGRGAFVPMRHRVIPDDAQWHRSMFVCLDSHLAF